ncbi:hypothetical protein AV521_18955 [Streptomyces sp. IMTB 2501]|uniref:ABC transporter permease subunit n=1 Tax=Streptomyces sp. IMTB 2501 TaxID=1776340 RepID=UPI00096E453D|nr:ABC transporter permease subunit [Streptomyces sp. IMTB 2501]OLZ68885.1 hypothetical protein AV521_18955 [Streptomyces sp. IMTB 2501]
MVFAAGELLPEDAASATSERGATTADIAAGRHQPGLDRPVWERFWDRMADPLADPLPSTMILGLTAFAPVVALAVPPGRFVDRTVGHSAAAFTLPEFVISVALAADAVAVNLAGTSGSRAEPFADQAATPHKEAAPPTDGLPVHRGLLRHQLPGAVPATAKGFAASTGVLPGGAMVVETVFNHPGSGNLPAGTVASRDTPLIAGVATCTSRGRGVRPAGKPRSVRPGRTLMGSSVAVADLPSPAFPHQD